MNFTINKNTQSVMGSRPLPEHVKDILMIYCFDKYLAVYSSDNSHTFNLTLSFNITIQLEMTKEKRGTKIQFSSDLWITQLPVLSFDT